MKKSVTSWSGEKNIFEIIHIHLYPTTQRINNEYHLNGVINNDADSTIHINVYHIQYE